LAETYEEKVSPEQIFYYVYAIIYSRDYRTKFNDYLRGDFPRIPFIKNKDIFVKLSEIGEKLVELHIGKITPAIHTRFDSVGSNIVNNVKYEHERVYINNDQFFDGIPLAVWEYRFGAYQVLDKWLKSRRKRELNSKDIDDFVKTIEIIKRTIVLMDEIDKIVNITDTETILMDTTIGYK
jgi:predicted helicase